MTANTVVTSYVLGARRTTIFDGTAPGAATDILATDLAFEKNVSAVRVTVALTTGSVFNVTCTDGTSTVHVWSLNEGTALTAACLYTFVFGVSADDDGSSVDEDTGTALAYNFQVATDGVIEKLLVDEIIGPVL